MNSYAIFPIGDSAVTCHFGNVISAETNERALAMQGWLQQNPPAGIKDIIVAYSSLTIVYDAYLVKAISNGALNAYDIMSSKLQEAFEHSRGIENDPVVKHIPVCYEMPFSLDLGLVAGHKQISPEEVVRYHTSEVYRVYMIGFLPGFPYMASVPDQIAISRKATPRRSIAPGSVGNAGKQTGIYPLHSPGGWQIIGRTPLKLFDKNIPGKLIIKTGDLVKFYSVTMNEFLRSTEHNHQ